MGAVNHHDGVTGGRASNGAYPTPREDAPLEKRLHLLRGQVDPYQLDHLAERDVSQPEVACLLDGRSAHSFP